MSVAIAITAALLAVLSIYVLICLHLCRLIISREGKPLTGKMQKVMRNPMQPAWTENWRRSKFWIDQRESEKAEIRSEDGLLLRANFYRSTRATRRTVLAYHGYKSTGKNEYCRFSEFYLERLHYNLLIVDDRSHCESEGKYIGFGWLDRKDCLLWIEYLIRKFGGDVDIVLHGVSMGGAAVLMASGEQFPRQVKAVISDCAFTSAKELLRILLKKGLHLPAFPTLHLTSLLCRLSAGYFWGDASALKQIAKSKTPTLFIHGQGDGLVPVEMAHRLYDNCAAPKELLVVPCEGHALSVFADRKRYENEVNTFLNRYVGTLPETPESAV